ncbi:MAG: substrate-binding domain-containing protein [Pyramidobacter sp.]|jgi:phosphate transport system substrate-binding protein
MNLKKLVSGVVLAASVLSGCAFASVKGNISVLSREEGSGTRGAFIELMGIEKKNAAGKKIDYTTDEADITNSTSVIMTSVAGNPSSIGYASLGSLNETVKALKINGAVASPENIKNGSYKVARPFNIVVKGELKAPARAFLNFILSKEGQEVIVKNGYIAINDAAPAYDGTKPEGKVVVAGSSSVTPVMEKLKEAYQRINAKADIEVQQSDSTTGVTSAINGICDLGMASRKLKDSELKAGAKPTVIAMDGIAVIINKANDLDNLTMEQVRDIYIGKITSWDELK